jgi:hypothetical protein
MAATLAILLAVAAATPCVANEAAAPTVTSQSRPLQAAVNARLASADAAKAVLSMQEPAGGAGVSKPFFKSTKGVVVVVLLAGGITWALVSRSRDAVHSPAR